MEEGVEGEGGEGRGDGYTDSCVCCMTDLG